MLIFIVVLLSGMFLQYQFFFFFFFQAEDGIRDLTVTGVQTCALPICPGLRFLRSLRRDDVTSSIAPSPAPLRLGVTDHALDRGEPLPQRALDLVDRLEIGRASCRERG